MEQLQADQAPEKADNRVQELFDALTAGSLERFLDGCCPELVLTVRGSGAMTTLVAKSEIESWYRSMHELAGASFRSDVGFVLTEDRTHVVLLRHTLTRGHVEYQYETLNHCTLRDDGLASWFSHPVRPSAYARAWGIDPAPERIPVDAS
jgi:hypothetical protein